MSKRDVEDLDARKLHKGASLEIEGVDVDKAIQNNSCSKEYLALEACLVEHDRSWIKCQPAVKLLKSCNDKKV
jgi:hypothetical protein